MRAASGSAELQLGKTLPRQPGTHCPGSAELQLGKTLPRQPGTHCPGSAELQLGMRTTFISNHFIFMQ